MRTLALLLITTLPLAGCGSNNDIVRDCCYQGAIAAARINTLSFTLEDGSTVPVTTALPGFLPRPGMGGARYPVREVELTLIAQEELHTIYRGYDADRSTHVEQPEITVLYLREAARGLGVPVAHLGAGEPIYALDTSPADVMGLVYYIDQNRERMNRVGQKVFTEMDSQRDLMRTIYPPGGGPKPLVP